MWSCGQRGVKWNKRAWTWRLSQSKLSTMESHYLYCMSHSLPPPLDFVVDLSPKPSVSYFLLVFTHCFLALSILLSVLFFSAVSIALQLFIYLLLPFIIAHNSHLASLNEMGFYRHSLPCQMTTGVIGVDPLSVAMLWCMFRVRTLVH